MLWSILHDDIWGVLLCELVKRYHVTAKPKTKDSESRATEDSKPDKIINGTIIISKLTCYFLDTIYIGPGAFGSMVAYIYLYTGQFKIRINDD